MRLDLVLHFRRDHFSFSIRLRVLAGTSIIGSMIAVAAGLTLDEPPALRHLPVIVISPGLPANWPVTDRHRP